MDQNSRPLQDEGKVNLTLLINKQKWNNRTRKYVKSYGFLPFARNLSNKYGLQILDTGLDALKTPFQTAAEATGKFIGTKY